MLTIPKIHSQAQSLLHELRADGVTLTDTDVAWVYELGRNVRKPPTGCDDMGMVHVLGDLEFHPLTIGARLWLHDYGLKALPEDTGYSSFAFAFASVHAKQKDVLRRLSDPSQIFTMLMDWAKDNLGNYLPEQVEAVLDKVYPTDPLGIPPVQGESIDHPFSTAISRICDEVGGTPEQWTWEYTFDSAMSQIVYIGMKDAAQSDGHTPSTEPSLRALQALMYGGDLIRIRQGMPPKYMIDRFSVEDLAGVTA